MASLVSLRTEIRTAHLANSHEVLAQLQHEAGITSNVRERIEQQAAVLVRDIRADSDPGLMEVFLAEYGLSTNEGVALMCLAEALLRVPDAPTIDELIEDKIAPSPWGEHLSQSSSSLVNASTWALMLTGKVLDERTTGIAGILHGAVKRIGEPLIRVAVKRALKEMGNQFVLGETIDSAIDRAMDQQKKGYTYSYDMLGEAALTASDADDFFTAYEASIQALAARSTSPDVAENPGISIKLSALHPRYEFGQKERVMSELVERALSLTIIAKEAGIGLNIDAEESDRLDLSLDIFEAILRDKRLAAWDGFGLVVQAYSKRAAPIINWLYALAEECDRRIMVRLVKGAYWDTEIKRSQQEGLQDFPVFTRKSATDVSYICCAKKLLEKADRLYPQFATHNAVSVCAVLELADANIPFEFQRLHGMGESLHKKVMDKYGKRCRIYAPVGAHRDLLAYLARRLLENGANSSFVNQIVNTDVSPDEIARDPFKVLEQEINTINSQVSRPSELYAPERINSTGWDLNNEDDVSKIEAAREPFQQYQWSTKPLIAAPCDDGIVKTVRNPADPDDIVGTVVHATSVNVAVALNVACSWDNEAASVRSKTLNLAADLYEDNYGELFAALTREAGKTPLDAIAELREAVDFLRYYASQIEQLGARPARGLIACISPWNFPLAIFTGQISAALAAGCGVLAKPADPTTIVATIAVKLLHQAGVPKNVIQLIPGRGSVVGAMLTADARINGICFTGSTETARTINKTIANNLDPDALLIAETGGLNAMIVDSTALPEQAVKDIIQSSFQSAGQRCSALRVLYLQEDISTHFMEMLFGAMDELIVANPWAFATDVGPVIDNNARDEIADYVAAANHDGRVVKQLACPATGTFIGPVVIQVNGINDLTSEVFGPVLHIATFNANQIDQVIADINGAGYGLTFGLHTRIDDRVKQLTTQLNMGNIYVNRNQIGAIVGSQPFGGEGLSGTGPKAGGPHYLKRFVHEQVAGLPVDSSVDSSTELVSSSAVQSALGKLPKPARKALATINLPGPTGESNRLSFYPRGKILCLGPGVKAARMQAEIANQQSCSALIVVPGIAATEGLPGFLTRSVLSELQDLDAIALWSDADDLRLARKALAERDGALIGLLSEDDMAERCLIERHICIDTTAAGGNAELLAQSEQ